MTEYSKPQKDAAELALLWQEWVFLLVLVLLHLEKLLTSWRGTWASGIDGMRKQHEPRAGVSLLPSDPSLLRMLHNPYSAEDVIPLSLARLSRVHSSTSLLHHHCHFPLGLVLATPLPHRGRLSPSAPPPHPPGSLWSSLTSLFLVLVSQCLLISLCFLVFVCSPVVFLCCIREGLLLCLHLSPWTPL